MNLYRRQKNKNKNWKLYFLAKRHDLHIQEDNMLRNATALITGGASGLGRSAASHILGCGGRVVIADLPAQQALAESLLDTHPSAKERLVFSACDVTSESDVAKALDACSELEGSPANVNVIVNCAGIATPGRIVGKKGALPIARFQQVMDVNTVGTFNVCRLGAERMVNSESPISPSSSSPKYEDARMDVERGVIINTASIAYQDGQIGQAAYAASKGAIASMTLPLARDLASKGVRCMAIAPGLFLTPLLEGLPEKVRDEMGSKVPFPNRLGDPSEFGDLVGCIVNNRMLNGEVIRLDGAYRMPP